MDRKIEVGDEYDFRGTVVALADDGWPVVAFRDGAPTGGACRAVSPEMFVHATLVKRAERPLKVGEMAWLGNETWIILAIDGDFAWLKACGGNYRRIALFAGLRRAETP